MRRVPCGFSDRRPADARRVLVTLAKFYGWTPATLWSLTWTELKYWNDGMVALQKEMI